MGKLTSTLYIHEGADKVDSRFSELVEPIVVRPPSRSNRIWLLPSSKGESLCVCTTENIEK